MAPPPTKLKAVILFDGVCGLCNASIRFVIKHDTSTYFCFSSLQSDFAKELLEKKGIDKGIDKGTYKDQLDSILLIENDQIFSRSTAVLRILSRLQFPWNLLAGFQVVPRVLRDLVYRWVAKYRYRWWGKVDHCLVADSSVKNRFLS